MPEQFLTPQEVAAFLRVSRSTVYAMIGSGELKSFPIRGRLYRVPVAEVERVTGQQYVPPLRVYRGG